MSLIDMDLKGLLPESDNPVAAKQQQGAELALHVSSQSDEHVRRALRR